MAGIQKCWDKSVALTYTSDTWFWAREGISVCLLAVGDAIWLLKDVCSLRHIAPPVPFQAWSMVDAVILRCISLSSPWTAVAFRDLVEQFLRGSRRDRGFRYKHITTCVPRMSSGGGGFHGDLSQQASLHQLDQSFVMTVINKLCWRL